MNTKVDEYLNNSKIWQQEMEQLRKLLLDCGLTEEFKWRTPCYCFQGKNVVLIASFKGFCALSFLKGSLLQDPNNLLVSPGENSQSVRFFKFTNLQEIKDQKTILKSYVFEAIEIEKSGLKVNLKSNTELELDPELEKALTSNPNLKKAFEALTPGRQRGYNLYISSSKNSKTRVARIEKYVARILEGKGIHDCVCGLSKKMPSCDGSHKYICKETK